MGSAVSNYPSEKYCCMVMRINIDCNACRRKLRRIISRMKAIETHVIDKQQCRVYVCGRFSPADVAIKIRKKMNRRVEILEIQELDGEEEEVPDQYPTLADPNYRLVANQVQPTLAVAQFLGLGMEARND